MVDIAEVWTLDEGGVFTGGGDAAADEMFLALSAGQLGGRQREGRVFVSGRKRRSKYLTVRYVSSVVYKSGLMDLTLFRKLKVQLGLVEA